MLLDLNLPKLNGLEVMRILKSDHAQRHNPIVMLSASGEARDISESYRIGGKRLRGQAARFPGFLTHDP